MSKLTLEELQVLITAKTSGLQAELKKVSKQLKGLETTTQNTTKEVQKNFDKATSGIATSAKKLKVTLATLGIGKVLKDSFKLSRTYEASLGQVNRLLGQNSKAFQQWVDKNALTFGLAKSQAMEYASIYGNLLSGFMPDTTSLTFYTQELLKASSIIASNTGRTIEDVNQRLRSGLLGNTEAIEDLGVNVNVALLETTEAFKQLSNGKSWNKLSFQTQQQIRLMAILEQTSKKFGDSIQNNTNYQLMIFTAQLKNVALNLGNAFKPIVDTVLPILNSFLAVLVKATNTLAIFMNALFGTSMKQVATESQSASNGLGNVASGYEQAGEEAEKAGKKAKNALASFDEVNTLNFGSDSGSGGTGGAFDGIQLEDTSIIDQTADSLESRLTKLIDAIKREVDRLKVIFAEGFELGLGDFEPKLEGIKKSFNGIKQSIKDIFTDTSVIKSFGKAMDSLVLSLGKITGSVASIGVTIAQNLVGGVDKYLSQNTQYIKDRLIGMFDATNEITALIGSFAVSLTDIFNVFGGDNAQQITANIIGMFSNAFLGVTELALNVGADLIGVIIQPIIDNQDKFKGAFENLFNPIVTITTTLKDYVTNTYESIFKAYEKYIAPAFDNIKQGLSDLVGKVLDAINTYIIPTIDSMATKWSEFYTQYLQPVIDKAIEVIGKFALCVGELWKNVLAPFIGWIITYLAPKFANAFEHIGDIVLSLFICVTEVVGGVLTALGGVIDFISGVFTGDWRKAWEGVKQIFKGVFDSLVGIVKAPLNLIIDAINTVIRGLSKFKIEIPDWVSNVPGLSQFGGKSIGFNIPQIPKLARGGIVDSPTLAMIGEAGKEAVVPLENTSFVTTLAAALANAVMNAMQLGGTAPGGFEGDLVLELDGVELARRSMPYFRKEVKRTGVSLA